MRNPIASLAIQSYLSDRPKISEWLSTKKPETVRLYITQIKRFEKTTQTTLETLLDQLDNHQIKPTAIRTLILQATTSLSNANQVVTDAAIRSFFKYWATTLPTTSIKYEETQTYKPYTKPELQKLLGFTDKLLEKLYITIGAETGLRANTILQLTYGHVKEDLNKGTTSIAVRLEPRFHKGRKKSGYPFIGKRAIELLKQAIEEGLVKADPEARLFPYTDDSIRKIIKVAKRKAHLDPTIHPIHGLRSYFEAQLIAAGTHPSYIKMLHGRFDDTDAKHYTPRDIETLRPEYEHAYPHLDFLNNAPQQTQELSDKQTELQDLIKQQNERIQALQDQVGPINQALLALGNVFGATLPHKFKDNTSNASLREILTDMIPLSIKFGKQFGQKPPPNYVDVATKGVQDIPEEELKHIEELVKNGDLATAFTKMTKYIPIQLSQYQR